MYCVAGCTNMGPILISHGLLTLSVFRYRYSLVVTCEVADGYGVVVISNYGAAGQLCVVS